MGKQRRRKPLGSMAVVALVCILLFHGCFIPLGLPFFLPEHQWILENHIENDDHSPLADLNCLSYGGPEDASEMIYWRDITTDAAYTSPFYNSKATKYLTFEPDKGGWNNVRMNLETVIVMAHAMGRTLVMPPSQEYYLLESQKGESTITLDTFLPLSRLSREQAGLEIISTEEFLHRERRSLRPPHNRTQWDGMSYEIATEYQPWIRSVTTMPSWNPEKCIAVFSDDESRESELESWFSMRMESQAFPKPEQYFGHPVSVDAPSIDRLSEMRAGREQLCVYNATLQQQRLLHFHGKPKLGGRLLTHFYAFLFFENWHNDLFYKRLVRDHLRYADHIQCAAARVVQAVRDRAFQRTGLREFDAFHIRRGEFQYQKTRISAGDIYNASQPEIRDGAVVYVATDERDKTFFTDLQKHFDVVFLDDFAHLLNGMDSMYYGMVDQLVASQSRVFFGCWFSTFSGYINRIRGYHADKNKAKGYKHGIISSYYYAPIVNKHRMCGYWPLFGSLYAREFPTSWRDIDHDS
ncbi:hypothetical protein FisN_10Hh193 [Fistulifera solaris]|uniref:O-fucosyltransferase family protein n=1 Tax=Fistulifera solaris TaxID=1519565 RepID=A0A1Z5JX41_FISSO|nr:hypothetical protein FisN_10Hh193 [Fistulifera solaris]|eukprot:GAX18600.1 hypothetical protein FisN_10Hh193 [Fistulifera solaris]